MKRTRPRHDDSSLRTRTARFACGLAAAVLGSGPLSTRATEPDGGDKRPRYNLVLITVDTLRADHLGCYGYRLETSPTIDALAKSGVRFADATVQWPKTWPSMASMLTGTYPDTNGIRLSPRRPLPPANVTLAEMLKDAGYRTAAVVSNANLSRHFAFDQGFEHFVEAWAARFKSETGESEFRNSPGLVKKYADATFVTDEAIRWVGEIPADQPFMLWAHYMEPHGPYIPPQKYATLFAGQYASKRLTVKEIPHYQLQYDTASTHLITDHGFYMAQYDREIRYLDDELGRLFDALDRTGRREQTLVVFTADHGESLGEHDYYFEHGRVPYQTTGQVPWIMSLPGRLPADEVLPMPVGLIDLVPTVLEILGLDRPASVEGVSLYATLRGESSEAPPFVYMEAGRYEPSQLVVRWGPWKLVHFRHPRDRDELKRGEFALFNLHVDPGEVHDVGAAHPDVVESMRRALDGYGRGDGAVADATEESETLEGLDPETARLLKSLGYLD